MTMYTPDDIRNIQFTKSMGGYKTAEVDPFIDKCADTVEALLREKAELTKKLEVLADKLVEYRNDEDNIRTALLSAQRLGDTVVREANHKAGLILEDANIKAEKITSVAKRNIQEEEAELERIKREVAAFKKKMLSMYRDHLTLIDALPELKEEPPASPEVPAEEPPAAPVPEAVPPRLVAAVEPVAGGPRRSRPAGGSGSPSRCGADAFLRRQHPAAAGGRDPGGIRYPQGGAGRWQAPQSPLHGFEVRVGIRHLRGYRRGHRLL